MTSELFARAIDELLAGYRTEALALFEAGVPPQHCVRIAMQIFDAKTEARAKAQHRFVGGMPLLPRQ